MLPELMNGDWEAAKDAPPGPDLVVDQQEGDSDVAVVTALNQAGQDALDRVFSYVEDTTLDEYLAPAGKGHYRMPGRMALEVGERAAVWSVVKMSALCGCEVVLKAELPDGDPADFKPEEGAMVEMTAWRHACKKRRVMEAIEAAVRQAVEQHTKAADEGTDPPLPNSDTPQ